MLTKKISNEFNNKPYGFLSWKKDSLREQREIQNFLSVDRGESNQLILDDPFVSRHHIRIERSRDTGLSIGKIKALFF